MKPSQRKITKVGNSYGVTLPPEVLKEANVGYGDSVSIDVKEGEIRIRKSHTVNLPEGVHPRFMETMNETIKRYDKTLRKLKDK